MIFSAGRSAGLARDDGAQFRRIETFRQRLDLRGFPDPSPPSKEMNRPRPGTL